MKISRIFKTLLMIDFLKALIIAIKKHSKLKKHLIAFEKGKSVLELEVSML